MSQYDDLCRHVKTMHDSIHGYIRLSVFAIKIIDTKMFQRLRKLKQLGTCNYVYPNAVHTRFEHSIGTYHVASELLDTIVNWGDASIYQCLKGIPELQHYYQTVYENKIHPLDIYICELVKIAALCHDIGHGPFSHVFDDVFLPEMGKKNNYCSTHEERSGVILEMLIKNDKDLCNIINDNEIMFMKNLINPKNEHTGFIYQIVSNPITGLDVDKFDYLTRDVYMLDFQAKIDPCRLVKQIRVIDNKIVYPEQTTDDIYNLFQTRYRLHKQVYCHKAVISAQFFIVEIMKLLDDILKISESITDMNKFSCLTDEYILESINIIDNLKGHRNILTDEQYNNLIKAKKIINNLEKRNLYTVICSIISSKPIDYKKYLDTLDDKNNIIVFHNKVGFVSGDKPNPFDSIYVYKTKDSSKISGKITIFKKDKNDITILMPKLYQEYIITFYYTNKKDMSRIQHLKEYFENSLKTN